MFNFVVSQLHVFVKNGPLEISPHYTVYGRLHLLILVQDTWQVQNTNASLSKDYREQFEVTQIILFGVDFVLGTISMHPWIMSSHILTQDVLEQFMKCSGAACRELRKKKINFWNWIVSCTASIRLHVYFKLFFFFFFFYITTSVTL